MRSSKISYKYIQKYGILLCDVIDVIKINVKSEFGLEILVNFGSLGKQIHRFSAGLYTMESYLVPEGINFNVYLNYRQANLSTIEK